MTDWDDDSVREYAKSKGYNPDKIFIIEDIWKQNALNLSKNLTLSAQSMSGGQDLTFQ